MPISTGNTSAPNDFARYQPSDDFFKYRAPLNTATTGYPSYATDSDFNGKSAFEPSLYGATGNLEQPSSWLNGNDFNSMAGELFTSKSGAVGGENSFGNLSLNLDQIKIVKQRE